MDTRSWTFVLSSCIGKIAFATPQLAKKVQRRRSKKRGTYKVKQEVYRCDACGQFHIGTRPKSLHASPKRARTRTAQGDDGMV